jgi:hypothetical protein
VRDDEYVGDCSFINFVQFWLHAETLERRSEGENGDESSDVGDEVECMVEMLQDSHKTEEDAQKVDWFKRLRARMKIDRTLSMPQHGDPSECIQRSKILASVHMGVGVIPRYHPTMVSHRKERSSLVRFQPAKEFTQQEVIRQRRARNSKKLQGDGDNSSNQEGDSDVTGVIPPPPLPEHLQRRTVTKGDEIEKKEQEIKRNKEAEEELEEDDEKTKIEKREKKKQRLKKLASAKRMEDAKTAAIKAEARAQEMKRRMEEKKVREGEEARIQAEKFELEQKKERKRMKKIEREKLKVEKEKRRQEKSATRQAKKETGNKKRNAKKTRAKGNKVNDSGRRRIDNGTGEDTLTHDSIKLETPEERNKRLEETERRGERARKKGHQTALRDHEKKEKVTKTWGLLKSVTKVASAVTDVVWNVRSRTALELVTRKEELRDQRKEARKKAMRLALSGGKVDDVDLEKLDGQLKAPQDEDSILARKKLLQKQFDPHALLGVNHEEEGWQVSYNFKHSGYAHKTNLNLVKLRPLQFFN